MTLDGKSILELGCGKARIAHLIASNVHDRKITATEADEIQHGENTLIEVLASTTFLIAGSGDIPFSNDSFDDVFALRSPPHHVPVEHMGKALRDVKSALKPGSWRTYLNQFFFYLKIEITIPELCLCNPTGLLSKYVIHEG